MRYRPVRPHARGGLGEVFVALDEELGREVALKQIQAQHADQAESRRRFVLEAEVTGGLEHPGIVPVYGLGQYTDGRPYYAMRFIRGRSLKEAIEAFHEADSAQRDPGQRELELRQLLARFIDICDAIAYAHSRGVLHRDLKPANVMLGSFGETLVVDWGLAKPFERPAGEGAPPGGQLRLLSGGGDSQTLFGSTVGTPSFMSPEQAEGRLDLMKPTSDVYSLGAILYCLLTGALPFSERNLAVLLKKVQRGEFVPPRQLNRKVPSALNAVCLKAMALRPENRYPSARALADDVEHWLAGEPVSVYREPFVVRLARWAKRHKTLVTATAALLVTAVTALSIGTVLIKREQQRTEANFQLARAAVDQMLTELGEVELADVPQMEPVREKMLDKALTFYRKFLTERGDDPSIRQETGRANIRLGDIQEMLGDYGDAERAYLRATALLGLLAAADPRQPEPRRDLARAQHDLGLLLKKSNRFDESERAFREALRLRQELAREFPDRPDDRRDEKDTVYHLGALLARVSGRLKEVEAAYQEAVEAERALTAEHPDQPDNRRKLARYLNNRGNLLMSINPREAEPVYREALKIQQALVDRSPTVAGNQWGLARTENNLGMALEAAQSYDASAAAYRESLARLKRLSDDFPTVPDYQHELAAVAHNLGLVLMGLNQPQEAEAHLRDSVVIYTKLADRFAARPDYRQKLAVTQRKLGILLANLGRPADAEKAFRQANDALAKLVAEFPKVPEYQSALGLALDNLAVLLSSQNRMAEARQGIDEAIRHQWVALESNPQSRIYREFLLKDFAYLEKALALMGQHGESDKAAGDVLRFLPNEPRAYQRAARLLATAALLAGQDPQLSEPKREELARGYAGEAVQRLREAVDRKVNVLDDLRDPVYDPLRDREDFQRLKQALEAKAQTGVG
jgi:serine/threonine-protein kinase